jgi:two-component system phosphate regulon response regulator PhoB
LAKARILVVEDEKDIAELLRINLSKEGYEVELSTSGEDGLTKARELLPDLVILDIMLPGIDGMEVCNHLKQNSKTRHVPVIMLTARADEADIVSGLEVGADDYLTKPFSPKVLIAHIRALLRRLKQPASDGQGAVEAGGLVIDQDRFEVTAGGEPVSLTLTEFRLLLTLARRPGWVFSRWQLVDEIRGQDAVITDRAIDVQIAGLRKKLGRFGQLIETVRGVGYRFRKA